MAIADKPTCTIGYAATHLKRRMAHQFKTGQRSGGTPLWLGAPGCGKSAMVAAVAADMAAALDEKVLLWTVTLADREVTDVRGAGIPIKTADGMLDLVYSRSGILPPRAMLDDYDRVVLFIDEIPAATQDHMKTIAAPLNDYVVGTETLNPESFFIVGAGNDTGHRAGAQRIPSHVLNRCCTMFVTPDHRAWLDYAYRAGIAPMATAFVDMKPSLLTESEIPVEPNTPWATFRSFTNMVADLSVMYEGDFSRIAADSSDATIIASGYVGAGVAKEFVSFCRVATTLTPLKAILADPKGCAVPETSGAAFAQASYLIEWTPTGRTAKDMEAMEAMMTFLGRLRADMLVSTALRMLAKNPSLTRTLAYGEMARANKGLIGATLSA